jgi:hypothetical protein
MLKTTRKHALEDKKYKKNMWGQKNMWRLGLKPDLEPVGSPSGRLTNPSGRVLPHKQASGCARPDVLSYHLAV